MRLDPLVNACPLTGAVTPVTTDLPCGTDLAPRADARDVGEALADLPAPWAESLLIAPAETRDAVERALRGAIRLNGAADEAAFCEAAALTACARGVGPLLRRFVTGGCSVDPPCDEEEGAP